MDRADIIMEEEERQRSVCIRPQLCYCLSWKLVLVITWIRYIVYLFVNIWMLYTCIH